MNQQAGGLLRAAKLYLIILCVIGSLIYIVLGFFPTLLGVNENNGFVLMQTRPVLLSISGLMLLFSFLLFRSLQKDSVRRQNKASTDSIVPAGLERNMQLQENMRIIENCQRQLEHHLSIDAYIRRSALLHDKLVETEALVPDCNEYHVMKEILIGEFTRDLPLHVERARSNAIALKSERGRINELARLRQTLEKASLPEVLQEVVTAELSKLPIVHPLATPEIHIPVKPKISPFAQKVAEEMSKNAPPLGAQKAPVQNHSADTAKPKYTNSIKSATDSSISAEKNLSSDVEPPQVQTSAKDRRKKSRQEKRKKQQTHTATANAFFKVYTLTATEERFFKAVLTALESAGLDPNALQLHKMCDNTYRIDYGSLRSPGKVRFESDNNYMQYYNDTLESQELIHPTVKKCISMIPKWIAFIQYQQAQTLPTQKTVKS